MDHNFFELLSAWKVRIVEMLKDGSQGYPVSTERNDRRRILEAINEMRTEQGFEDLPITL